MSEFKLNGTIKTIADVQKGVSKSEKEWQKEEFAITNNDGYNGTEQVFAFEIFGQEKVEKFIQYNKVGKAVEVSFNIKTNEYKDKYYTSLQAWKVFGAEAGESKPVEEFASEPDDLPF